MSFRPPAKFDPSLVWGYNYRFTNEIELYSSSYTTAKLLYRAKIVVGENTKIVGMVIGGNALLTDGSDDLIPSSTETVITSSTTFNPALYKDKDDSTYTSPGSLTYGSTYDLVKYDLGSVDTYAVLLRATTSTGWYINELISSDDITYTTLVHWINYNALTRIDIGTFRYIKLQADGTAATANGTVNIYSFEIYKLQPTPYKKELTYATEDTRLITLISDGSGCTAKLIITGGGI